MMMKTNQLTAIPFRKEHTFTLMLCVFVLRVCTVCAHIKGPLIQTDRGINTIPNLIDPRKNHSIISTAAGGTAHRGGGGNKGINLFLSLHNDRVRTQTKTTIESRKTRAATGGLV